MRAWGISVDCWGMNIPFFSYFFGYENCALLLRHLDETELLCHMAACRCNAAGADLCNQKTRSFKWNWSWECCVLHGHGRFYVCISLVVERALASAGITAVIGLRQAWTYWEMQHLGSRLQGIVNVWLLMWSAVLWSVLFLCVFTLQKFMGWILFLCNTFLITLQATVARPFFYCYICVVHRHRLCLQFAPCMLEISLLTRVLLTSERSFQSVFVEAATNHLFFRAAGQARWVSSLFIQLFLFVCCCPCVFYTSLPASQHSLYFSHFLSSVML